MWDFAIQWTHGLRFGLWYYDFSGEGWEDEPYNLGICLDLGLFNFILFVDPKEGHEAFDE